MTRGLMYVAIGKEYDLLASRTIEYSRHFTGLPICVISNLPKEERDIKWEDLEGIGIIHVDIPQLNNRQIKTTIDRYSPFDETILLDSDSIVQNPGIEKLFDMMEDHDMLLNLYMEWGENDKIIQIFADTMRLLKVDLPIKVYSSALIGFKKNERTQKYFNLWTKYWEMTGGGRDMQAMACAIKQCNDLKIKQISTGFDKIFAPNYPIPEAIIQHNYNSVPAINKDFHNDFGLPRIQEFKPFDTDPNDWHWVDFKKNSKPVIVSIMAIHNYPLWRKCCQHLKTFCDKFYFRINTNMNIPEGDLKEYFGSKFGRAIQKSEHLNFWNWREDLIRMLDDVKPDIVISSDSDEIFEDGFYEEILRFWQSDKKVMRVNCKGNPTDDNRIPATDGRIYPSGHQCRVFKWQPGLSYQDYKGYCQVTNYANNNELNWYAEKGYYHYCFWTKEMENNKIKEALALYGEF